MALWKIEPTYKKSVIERTTMYKDNKQITEEIGWRWGEFTCETEDDNPPVIEQGVDLYSQGYDVEMQECFDGCWQDYEFEGFTEEEEEKMQEFLDENSFSDLESEGWMFGDTEMILACEPSIEKLENE